MRPGLCGQGTLRRLGSLWRTTKDGTSEEEAQHRGGDGGFEREPEFSLGEPVFVCPHSFVSFFREYLPNRRNVHAHQQKEPYLLFVEEPTLRRWLNAALL